MRPYKEPVPYHPVNIRLDMKQYAQLRECCYKLNLKPSELIRRLIAKEYKELTDNKKQEGK